MQKKVPLWRSLSKKNADGYGYASRKISSGLADIGLLFPEDFAVTGSVEYGVFVSVESGMEMVASIPPEKDIVLINNTLPDDYVLDHPGYNIGFTYWEKDALPSRWVQLMSGMDEIWTTSEWAADVFRSSGLQNVHAFKLGVDSEIYYLDESVPDGPFTFLHVGAPSTRKNCQMAVDAFIKLFGNNSDYRMIVKSIGPPDARMRGPDGSNQGPVSAYRNVEVIDYEMTEYELAKLYRDSHCLVYPTRGEGWGMIPFFVISSGTPTICTNFSSCEEYAHLSVPLDYTLTEEHSFGVYRGAGKWAEPSFDDLCDKMLYVVENYDEVKRHTVEGGIIIHRDYSWDKVVQEYKERLCQILNT